MGPFTRTARLNRAKARLIKKGDPLADHHVLRGDRRLDDPPRGKHQDGPGGSLTPEDLHWYKAHPDG